MGSQKLSSEYKVYDIMTINPVCVAKDCNIQEAAKIMKKNEVASVVVKEDDKYLGIITEKDIVRNLVAKNNDPINTTVQTLINKDVKTVKPTEDIYTAISHLNNFTQRQLPVLENEKLVGLLTLKDILRVQPQLFGLVYEQLQIREESRKPVRQSTESEGICNSCGNYSYNLLEEDDMFTCPTCRIN